MVWNRLTSGSIWPGESPYDAVPLFLYGWSAWRQGNGTLAGIAADRALASDPDYTAADLLTAALRPGIDPRRIPAVGPTGGDDAPSIA